MLCEYRDDFMKHSLLLVVFSLPLFAQAPGTIETIAGTGAAAFSGDGAAANLAAINLAVDVSADRFGNLYIADQFNHRIRRIAKDGTITTVAGTGVPGFSGDGGQATSAQINTPTGVFADVAGNIYIADVGNQRIRMVNFAGVITTIAGNGSKGYGGDGGQAVNASFYNAVRVAVDPTGNVIVADQSNHRIRKITPGGIITTIAGNGVGTPAAGAFSGDGGQATAASLNNPTALAIAPSGVIYFSDQVNQRIRKIAADGTITTISGTGSPGYGGDKGPAINATLNYPGGMTLDAAGNLYFSDDLNFRVRRIDTNGVMTTIAGNGVAGFAGDGADATLAALNGEFGLTIDAAGSLYIADSINNRIRQVFHAAAPGPTPSISTGGVVPIYSAATTIQAGSWISIFGNNLATGTTTWNGDFPTTLGGTSVRINSKLAYLWYVSPTQINLQAPDDTTPGSANVVVITPTGSATSTTTLGTVGPSFSVLDGKHVAGIILRTDGSGAYGGGTYDIIGPTGTSLGYKTVAAKAGDTVELYGVGFGPTNPVVPAGRAFTGSAPTTNSVQISVNGNNVPPAFAGLTSAGLYQINLVQIPVGLGTGDVPLRATVAGVQTPAGVVISLQ
jgi:uncharacterized protein (TIGR03437 family)